MPIDACPTGREVTDRATATVVTVKGPKGDAQRSSCTPEMRSRRKTARQRRRGRATPRSTRSHGLTRTLLANMVVGVSDGFQQELEINGVGYRAQIDRARSWCCRSASRTRSRVTPPDGVTFSASRAQHRVVGQRHRQGAGRRGGGAYPRPAAARAVKGKGINTPSEKIRRKAGKAGKVEKS